MRTRLGSKEASARETLVVFLLLYIASFKDDSATIAASDYWSELTLHPVVQIFKSHSDLALVPLAALMVSRLLIVRGINLRGFGLSIHLLLLALYASFRSLIYDVSYGDKIFAGFLILALIGVFAVASISSIGVERYRASVVSGLVMCSLFLILCNGANALTGYGFVPGNPRMFGTASHPNFLGVQMALAGISIVHGMVNSRSPYRIIYVVALFIGALVLIFSGSRTGLVMFVCGSALYLFCAGQISGYRGMLFSIFAGAVIVMLLLGDISSGPDSFQRGYASDTRMAAWAYLWDEIERYPVWGKGYFVGFTESSYLRGWATYGIVYVVLLVAGVGRMLVAAARAAKVDKGSALIFATASSLAVGAIFEGYLVDVFSFPLVLFFLISTTGFEMRKYVPRQPIYFRFKPAIGG
jgi:hypothetical protein